MIYYKNGKPVIKEEIPLAEFGIIDTIKNSVKTAAQAGRAKRIEDVKNSLKTLRNASKQNKQMLKEGSVPMSAIKENPVGKAARNIQAGAIKDLRKKGRQLKDDKLGIRDVIREKRRALAIGAGGTAVVGTGLGVGIPLARRRKQRKLNGN